MRIFIFLVLTIFLFSCSDDGVDQLSSSPYDNSNNPITSSAFFVVGDYNGNLWKKEWTQFVYDSLEEQNSGLLTNDINTGDLAAINCSNFNSLGRVQKKMFWALFMSSFSHYESSFNPNERYWESSMWKYSEGLFQLSTSDSSYYSDCDVDSSNILDPKENIRCAVSILDVQVEGSSSRAGGRLFPSSYFYWSVLTNSTSKNKVQSFFKQRVKELLPFCS